MIATVKGDVHDIGKNIVGVVLGCNNYRSVLKCCASCLVFCFGPSQPLPGSCLHLGPTLLNDQEE